MCRTITGSDWMPGSPKKFPRHGKAFSRPVRLSPKARRQVGITLAVQKYAEGFKAKGLEGTSLAGAIVQDIADFGRFALSVEKAKRIWGRRSANDIIKTKRLYIMMRDEAAATRRPAVMGCTDASVAALASLRAAGFKAIIARAGVHTYCKVFYRGKTYIADPADHKRNQFREMTRGDKRNENKHRAAKAFAEGTSLADIGVSKYSDFFKYEYKGK